MIKHTISNQIGVTGRFGVFLDKYFLYGLAGLQLSANRFYAQAREREFFFSYDTTSARRKNTGLLIGAGIQKALVDNIEIGIEFKYAKLGNKTYTYNVNDGYNTTLTSKINYNMSTIAVRLVYAF